MVRFPTEQSLQGAISGRHRLLPSLSLDPETVQWAKDKHGFEPRQSALPPLAKRPIPTTLLVCLYRTMRASSHLFPFLSSAG